MKENINDIINIPMKELGIELKDIHHVETVYSCPDKYFKIIHYQGDAINSWWRKILGIKKYYSQTIVYNSYDSKEYTLTKLCNLIDSKHELTNDDTYPIWYTNGINIYLKDSYNNPIKESHIFFTNKYKIQEIEEFVCKINYELHKDKLDFFGYKKIDMPIYEAVRYNVTNREPVKLNCIAEASPNIMLSLDRDKIIDYLKKEIIRGFTNSDDFKSLVKYNINNYNHGGTISMNGYIEILKDKE